MTIDSLPTPAVLIDRARLIANMDRMQSAADTAAVRLRPHSKTHKSPQIAKWQIERGAVGICCAKLGEAEVFAEAGIADIRIPYPLNPSNADRVIRLLDRTHLSFIVDHPVVARRWSEAMTHAGRRVDVLVKVDVGFHRCGIDPSGPDAVGMIRDVAGLPGLRLRGLLAHAGHAYHAHSEEHMREIAEAEVRTLCELATACRQAGVCIDELSAGATPPARYSLRQRGITEYRPGNYVYFDRTQVALGAATIDDCALTVLATVVSKPASDRIVLDCGSKTLSSDGARGFSASPGHGLVLLGCDSSPDGASASDHPSARPPSDSLRASENLLIERLSEEHATVRVVGTTALEPGDRVRVLPNHSCVVSNLVDRVWLVDGNSCEPLAIAARGCVA